MLGGLHHLSQAEGASSRDWVLVHDAARPGLTVPALERLRSALADGEAGGLLAIPVAQWRQDFVFLVPDKYALNYVSIAAPIEKTGEPPVEVTVDGELVKPEQWTNIGKNFKFARLFVDLDSSIGAPDIAIYNASYRTRGPFVDLDPVEVERSIAVTAYGGFLVAREAVRRMLPDGMKPVERLSPTISVDSAPMLPLLVVPTVLGVMLGAMLGGRLLRRVSARTVRYTVVVLLLAAGLRSLIKGLAA